MADKPKAIKVTTPKFRLSFPSLDAPRGFEGQEPKYSATMLFAKDTDMSWLKSAMTACMIEKFGADKTKWPKQMKNPIRDGDDKETPTKGYEGHFYVTARSKDKPGCVSADVQDIIDVKNELYAGCYARATIALYFYDKAGNRGIGIALNNVQKLGEGEKFSGKADAKSDFEPVAVDPAAGTDADDEMFK
jgi:hypothetical protein